MKDKAKWFIAGVVSVVLVIVLIGATSQDSEVGRYQVSTSSALWEGSGKDQEYIYITIIDTKTGEVIKKLQGGQHQYDYKY